MEIRVKICAWHWLLLTLKTRSIKLLRRFEQTTLTFIGVFKKPTKWRLSNGSQFCACYASKDITNNRCAWLREGFVNIWDANVFVSRVAVSANTRPQEKVSCENYEPCPQLSAGRSLYYGQIGSRAAPWTLELLSPTRTALLCSLNLVSKALSVCP